MLASTEADTQISRDKRGWPRRHRSGGDASATGGE